MKVSVVVPCRNEKANIKPTIQAIYKSGRCLNADFEVLVIDGDSDDGTQEVLIELGKEYLNLKVVQNEKRITPVAFNLGIKNSKGKYIQIVGARQIISENYLSEAIAFLEKNEKVWCVGGKVINNFSNYKSQIIANAMSSPFGMGGDNFRVVKHTAEVDTVGTPMYPAHVFNKVGFFDELLVRNQDDEFNYRVRKAGGKIFILHNIYIRYLVRAEYRKLYKQYFQYGYWKVFVNKKHHAITTLRQLVPALFILFIVLGGLLSTFIPQFTYLYWFGCISYGLLHMYFSLKDSNRLKEFFMVGYAFLVIHFGYGLGYLKGILDFLILRKEPSNRQMKLTR